MSIKLTTYGELPLDIPEHLLEAPTMWERRKGGRGSPAGGRAVIAVLAASAHGSCRTATVRSIRIARSDKWRGGGVRRWQLPAPTGGHARRSRLGRHCSCRALVRSPPCTQQQVSVGGRIGHRPVPVARCSELVPVDDELATPACRPPQSRLRVHVPESGQQVGVGGRYAHGRPHNPARFSQICLPSPLPRWAEFTTSRRIDLVLDAWDR